MNVACYLLPVFLIISSCRVSSNYGRLAKNQYSSEYERYLTNEDGEKLKNGKDAFINYNNEHPTRLRKGTVRVIPISGENQFNYVEIGEWHEDLIGGFANDLLDKKLIQLRTESVFDSLGNIITQKIFSRHQGHELALGCETVYQKEVILGKEYYFYHDKFYNESGILIQDEWVKVVDHKEAKPAVLKKLVKVKEQKIFNQDGTLKSVRHYDLEGKLISNTKS